MKILFLARRFYPDIGGVEKHLAKLNKELLKKGHTITVIAEVSQKDSNNVKKGEKTIVEGVEVYKISSGDGRWNKKITIWKELWRLRNLILNSDVIHCHDVFFWYLPFRFFYPQKRVYTTFHGYESYPIRWQAIVVRKISEKLSNGNICIGDFITKWYKTNPTVVSYGAVEQQKINNKKINAYSALFFGRLDEQTGIEMYLKTFHILKKKYKNFTFQVVGDGEYQSKIGKDVAYLGFQKNPEKYFAQNHFAFLSRYLSLLEAFMAKRLVFAVYDNPVKEDYLKMAPYAKYIIISNDPKKLAERVSYFLEHPEEEKKLTTLAFNWAKKQTWEKMAHIYLSLWKK